MKSRIAGRSKFTEAQTIFAIKQPETGYSLYAQQWNILVQTLPLDIRARIEEHVNAFMSEYWEMNGS